MILIAVSTLTILSFAISAAWAGNPHFVGTPTVTRQGNSLTVSGKVAGLGNEEQIHVEVSADAACLNRGEQFPDADNKETFTASGDFPVQNGKANFRLSLTATFQPRCSPPMRVVFGDVSIVVTSDDDPNLLLTTTIAGPF
jgi:hypothetical protein